MKTFPFSSHVSRASLALSLLLTSILAPPALADEPGTTIPYPGYRPDSEQAAAFLEAVGQTSFDVLPTMIHRIDRTAHSFESQELIVDFVNEHKLGNASAKPYRVDLGILERRSQFDLFKRGMAAVAGEMAGYDSASDYTLAMEILVPGDQAVFGVHVFVLDRQGRNAFSFVLNSHHRIFAEAGLVASSTSEDARAKMIADATRVGLNALQSQIEDALECARSTPTNAQPAEAGILHDFESEVSSAVDNNGIPIGYSTFAGPNTRVTFETTQSYPPRDSASGGSGALKIGLDVNS